MTPLLRTTRFLLVLFCMAAIAPSAHAVLITGTMNVTGVGPIILSGSVIDFTTPVNPVGDGTGLFDIIAGSTGSFVPIIGTTTSIRDLNAGVVPAGVPVNYANFVTFVAQPTWSITLTQLLPGVFSSAQCGLASAAGQVCTPFSSSPFNLTNTTATSSILTFAFIGTAVDSTTPSLISSVQGVFTVPFSGMNFQQILAAVGAPGGSVNSSDSASFTLTNPVPEPGTLGSVLLGGLLIGASFVSRRLRR